MSDIQQPNYYTNIPASVRYDKDIPANAKLLYGEIGCLSNKYGYCFARNDYFANLYNLSEDRISRLIHLLEKKGYIEITIIRNEQNFIVDRKIKQLDPGLYPSKNVKNNDTDVKNNDTDVKNNDEETVKIPSSDVKNNETIINTINNKTLNNNTTLPSEIFPPSKTKKGRTKKSESKKESEHLFSQEIYTDILTTYRSEFYSLFDKSCPPNLGKNYKNSIDNTVIQGREFEIADNTTLSNIKIAIQKAKNDQYIVSKGLAFSLILSKLSELVSSTSSSKNPNYSSKKDTFASEKQVTGDVKCSDQNYSEEVF